MNGEKERSADSVRCLFCISINKVLLFLHYLLKLRHIPVLFALELTLQYDSVDTLQIFIRHIFVGNFNYLLLVLVVENHEPTGPRHASY